MATMSKKDREERFETIAALLRKAEDPSVTPAEAAEFTDGAMRLAKKYEIDLTLARDAARDPNAATRGKREVVEEMDKFEIALKRPKMQQSALAGVAFRYAGCYLLRFGTGNALRLVAFGYESDLEEGKLLWESLSRQAFMQCSVRYHEHKAQRAMSLRDPEVERTYRRGFWDEFTRTVNGRLQRIGREVIESAEAMEPLRPGSHSCSVRPRSRGGAGARKAWPGTSPVAKKGSERPSGSRRSRRTKGVSSVADAAALKELWSILGGSANQDVAESTFAIVAEFLENEGWDISVDREIDEADLYYQEWNTQACAVIKFADAVQKGRVQIAADGTTRVGR